jgi:arginase family enzyme
MLNKAIRILNFDNSVIQQSGLLEHYAAEIIDLTGLAPHARLFMSAATRNRIKDILAPTDRFKPAFLGSGDFHHISEVLTGRIDEPFCMIVFDFHPDWDTLPPRFGCGSWVSQSLHNEKMLKCVLIGVGSADLSGVTLQSGNLSALEGERLEIYPFRHKPSRVFFRQVPENRSIVAARGFLSTTISWRELEKADLEEFTLELVARLPARKVYISIDKDCLKKEFALTNWEEGCLSLDQLLLMLRIIRRNAEIIGLDVTGDYSPPQVPGRLKAVLSRLDHPKNPAAHNCYGRLTLEVNQRTNLEILQELFS